MTVRLIKFTRKMVTAAVLVNLSVMCHQNLVVSKSLVKLFKARPNFVLLQISIIWSQSWVTMQWKLLLQQMLKKNEKILFQASCMFDICRLSWVNLWKCYIKEIGVFKLACIVTKKIKIFATGRIKFCLLTDISSRYAYHNFPHKYGQTNCHYTMLAVVLNT